MKKKTPMVGMISPKYEDSGFCSYCMLALEALQPGGRNPRHKATLTPYGHCPQAILARKMKKA